MNWVINVFAVIGAWFTAAILVSLVWIALHEGRSR